jgi:hypothetical protein
MQTEQNNEGQPLISFIIPLYNVPFDMLRDCVKSILKLSLSVDERQIIVVDDGSEQSPVQMLTELDDGIIYIRQKNRGVSAARNTGLRMAEGQYIQFVDADDILLQAPYEHVLDLVRYDGSDIVMFDFCERPPKSLNYSDFEPATGSEWLRRNNIHGSAWGYVFRSSILGSLRFTPGISYGEDEEFTPQLLLRADRVRVTTAQAYLYSTRPASAINRRDMRSRLKRLNDAKHVILSLRAKATTMPPEESIAIQRRTAQLTMDYIYNVIVMTRSSHYLERKISELSKAGLFPLPNRDYTRKYTWFRRMTNCRVGRAVLLRTLPLMERER